MGLEAAWKRCIASENKRLVKLGRPAISRYHASDCSSRRGEYKGWDTPDQIAFVKRLFAILKNYATYTVVWDVKISDVVQVFPEAKQDPLRACYSILTKFMLDVLGQDIGKSRITLIHDRNDYNLTILQAFDKMVNDPNFKYGKSFTSITACSWEDCIALQPADLVAFEVFKRASGYKRKSFDVLLDLGSFGIRSKRLPLDVLQKIKADLIKDGKIEDGA
jgi:hypothetical protein